jgi:choline dehydrogenase-like flavoprotein
MTPGADLRCRELVVGSGPGGSVTACLLARAGRDVIVAEEGPDLPLESCEPFGVGEMLQKYRCGGLTVSLGSPKVSIVEGRVAGGGSEVNSGLYHRTPEAILAGWRERYGLADADPGRLEGHFRAVEEALGVGLMPTRASASSLKLAQGAKALGWDVREVPRWLRYDGTVDAAGVARGTRQSMSRTYLRQAREAGARLLCGARVDRLAPDGDGWAATGRLAGGGSFRVRATHVFACGGAVQTPLLLRASGVTRNVGDTLAMHPTVKVLARFPDEVGGGEPGVHQVKEFSPRIGLGCSISSLPYVMLAMAEHPRHRPRIRAAAACMASYYAMVTGPATGRVRATPFGPDPLIRHRLEGADMADLATGLRHLCRLLLAAGALELFPSVSGIEPLTGPADLDRIPAELPRGRTSLMTLHVFSSCPMGENRALAACDSFGRVHGVRGLSVHDASLLCTAPGVNPQGTVMAFAHRNTGHYLSNP